MALEDMVKQVAAQLAEEADVRAVFGDPLKLGQRVVIPVAVVRIHLGGLSGAFTRGGAGSADLAARPVGFICEEDGEVVFKPIEVPCGCRCHEGEEGPKPAPRKVRRRLKRARR